MIDHMIATLLQTKFGLLLGGVIVLTLAISILFYLQLAIFMICGTTFSIFKKLGEMYSLRKTARTTKDLNWYGGQLGVTMPDGGEPVSEKEEEKEK